MRRDPPPLPRDGIYRAILWALAVSAIGGVLIAIGAETLLNSPELNRLGAGVAVISGALYGFFRFLGAREAKRREDGEDGPGTQ